ncbi:MAG: tyrosine-type recombinase/integrase [Nitrososphaeraceae archaeon]
MIYQAHKFGDAYQNFVNTIKTPTSLKMYTTMIDKYFKFLRVDSKTCGSLLTKEKKMIESDIAAFLVFLRKEQNKKYLTAKNNLNAIKHFYHVNDDEELKWSRIQMYLGNDDEDDESESDRPYTMEEIQTLYITAQDMRAKFIIPLLTSTGMRSEGLLTLRIGDLISVDKYDLYQIKVYAKSKKYAYVTFCSPEARKEIDRYIEYRKKSGEKLSKQSPLLRNHFNINTDRVLKPRFLTTDALYKIITAVLEHDALLRGEGKEQEKSGYRYPVKARHGFRKFFITTASMNGMHPDWVDLLTGHKLPGVRGAYFKPTPEQLLEGTETVKGYKNIIDSVTINEENKLRNENLILKKKSKDQDYIINGKLMEKERQIEGLQQSIEKILDTLGGLTNGKEKDVKRKLAKDLIDKGMYVSK